MIDQAVIETFKPERRSEYARQHARPQLEPVTQTRALAPTRRSPLPSAREIDVALQAKYGTTRYGNRQRAVEMPLEPLHPVAR
jgi:hypothetical protein